MGTGVNGRLAETPRSPPWVLYRPTGKALKHERVPSLSHEPAKWTRARDQAIDEVAPLSVERGPS